VKPTKRLRSYERYEAVCRLHITPSIGAVPLTALATPHIKQLLAKLKEGGMAPAGVDLVRTVLHGAIKAALQQDLVARNVVDATPAPHVERTEVHPPSAQGVAGLLALAEAKGHPLFPALHLTAYTGCRRGEVLALTWQYVNLEAGTAAIVRSLGRARAGLVFEEPKTTAGRRILDLDDRTVEVLRAHRGHQLLQKMEAGEAYSDQGLVFANELGAPINPIMLTRTFQGFAKQAGLGHVKLHALRHSHASILFAEGEDIFAVSRRLGHASIVTTANIYGHVLPGAGKRQADAFARAMGRARAS
jgi:integrase